MNLQGGIDQKPFITLHISSGGSEKERQTKQHCAESQTKRKKKKKKINVKK